MLFRSKLLSGASYCDVGYNSKSPLPSPEKPLGVPWPGNTWCERPDLPNWVGYLVQKINAQRKDSPAVLAFDYALGGDAVEGVRRQVHRDFLPHLATRPTWAPWTASDTVFMTWVGINDCAMNAMSSSTTHNPDVSAAASVDGLFALQEELYESGARNFCLIDVPPTYKFPPRA